MKINKTISLSTKYNLPQQINAIQYKGKWLIIAPECCNYIVLEKEIQYKFYSLLTKYSLNEALSKMDIPKEDAQAVLIQIEAKHFVEDCPAKANGRFQLHMFLTNACNLRCKHCYMFSGQCKINELNFSEIKSILCGFKAHQGEFVTFSGGEVLMRKDLMSILQLTKKLQLNTTIMTNGTLWTESLVKEAAKYISAVQISIDGFNEKENAKVRGSGYFEKSLRSVELFLQNGIRVTIAMTPWYDEELFKSKDLYLNFIKEIKGKYIHYPLNFKFTSDIMDGRELSLSPIEQKRYFKFMQEISNDENENKEEEIFIYNQRNRILKDSWCTFGHLTISADGEVYFCGKVNASKPICNIRETDIDTIMGLSSKARDLSRIQNLYPCKECELRYICGGGCRIEYFDWFKECEGIKNGVLPKRLIRECNPSIKQHYYDLMIAANYKLYTPVRDKK